MRVHTQGYTGAKKADQRDTFSFNSAAVKSAIDRTAALTHEKLRSLPPWDFTQFVRGELFVLLDSLLTTYFARVDNPNVQNWPATELKLIFDLWDAYLQLYCQWLEELPSLPHSVLAHCS